MITAPWAKGRSNQVLGIRAQLRFALLLMNYCPRFPCYWSSSINTYLFCPSIKKYVFVTLDLYVIPYGIRLIHWSACRNGSYWFGLLNAVHHIRCILFCSSFVNNVQLNASFSFTYGRHSVLLSHSVLRTSGSTLFLILCSHKNKNNLLYRRLNMYINPDE